MHSLYLRKKKKLLPAQCAEIERELKDLEGAILQKDRAKASDLAKHIQHLSKNALKKSSFEGIRDLIIALTFALLVALAIRQTWFELYEIPSGSMRPTFEEQDRLIVTKSNFGVNVPFSPKHLYFDPQLMQRYSTVVFTVENMDMRDPDTLYFYLFPGKKQLVKRLIGKPGDLLYFYGGLIYGIDKDGKDISDQFQVKSLEGIDHIPMNFRFEGNVKVSEPFRSPMGEAYRNTIIYQMNEPIALLTMQSDHRLEGEMLNFKQIRPTDAPRPTNFGDLWGIKNFATARLVSKDQIRSLLKKYEFTGDEGVLFLELKHSPSLQALAMSKDQFGRLRPKFTLTRSIIPLNESQLKELFKKLYTARFVVKNGFAMRYSMGGSSNVNTHFLPKLNGVPDGTYEFYNGVASEVKWGGILKELKADHPLYQFSPERMQLFFNLGIDFDTRSMNDSEGELHDTSRYAYFRNGDFYVMNNPLLKKGDPTLDAFIAKESQRKDGGLQPFTDFGPPDMETIKQNGLRVPEGMYFVLGDNYAGSSDGRDFGFVPESNFRGRPAFIFWPLGSRLGPPNQPSHNFFNFPNALIWGVAATGFVIWGIVHRRRHRLPLSYG